MEDKVIYEIREMVVKISTTLENVVENTDLKLQLQDEKIKVANNRIADLEEANKWLWRTSIGAVIIGLIGAVIKFN